jgi:hypothetical protein
MLGPLAIGERMDIAGRPELLDIRDVVETPKSTTICGACGAIRSRGWDKLVHDSRQGSSTGQAYTWYASFAICDDCGLVTHPATLWLICLARQHAEDVLDSHVKYNRHRRSK